MELLLIIFSFIFASSAIHFPDIFKNKMNTNKTTNIVVYCCVAILCLISCVLLFLFLMQYV